MARCPFCHSEINYLYVDVIESVYKAELVNGKIETTKKVSDDDWIAAVICPRCLEELPISYDEAEEFLKGKIVLARVGSCTFRDDFAVRRGKVYKVKDERVAKDGKTVLLLLEEVEDDTVAAIVKASLV